MCQSGREVVSLPHLVIFKTGTLKWFIMTLFEMISWNSKEHFENKVVACIMSLFETIWNCRRKRKHER